MKRRSFILGAAAMLLFGRAPQSSSTENLNSLKALFELGGVFLASACPSDVSRIRALAARLNDHSTIESVAAAISAEHRLGRTIAVEGFEFSETELALMVAATDSAVGV